MSCLHERLLFYGCVNVKIMRNGVNTVRIEAECRSNAVGINTIKHSMGVPNEQ